jgi:hypothetical protein
MAIGQCRCLALLAAILLVTGATLSSKTYAQATAQNALPSKARISGPPCAPLADAIASPLANPGLERQTVPFQVNLQGNFQVNKDVCVSAHVYDIVEVADGTRFLDVCPAEIPDDQCRFTIVSLPSDRGDVGDLRRYRDQNIQLRGTLRVMHGRMGIIISHARQFNGGPEKFKPNPRLLRDFNGQSDRMPVRDPNLSSAGHHRSFMNRQDKEAVQPGTKP